MTAMITAAVVGVAGSAIISGRASDRAADASQYGADLSVEESRRQYDQTREDFAPWRESGRNALARLDDPTAFKAAPEYEWRRDEGTRNLENRFSARGGGGNAMRALVEYNQNFASNEYGNWWNREATKAGMGQGATGSTAAHGANMANNVSNAYMTNANNQSSIGLWDAGNKNNALQTGLSNWLYYRNRGN